MGLEDLLNCVGVFNRKLVASTLLGCSLLAGCSGSGEKSPPTAPSNSGPTGPTTTTPRQDTTSQSSSSPRLSSGTVVLDQSTLSAISSYSNGTFNFSSPTNQLNSLSVGKIIAVGITAATPYGALGKVSSISPDKRTVTTRQATLAEAIDKGSLSIRKRLTPAGLSSSYLREGVSLSNTANQVGFDFGVTFDKVVLDTDDNPSTTNDQFRISGYSNFNYEVLLDLDIGAPLRLDRFLLENIITQKSNISVSGVLPFTYFDKKIKVLELPLPPQAYFIPTAPPLPFVITPILKINVGVEGTTYIGLTANLQNTSSFDAGIKYENGNWSKISNFTNDFIFGNLSLSPSNSYSSIKGYAGPELVMLVDGVVGPNLGVEGYLKFNSDYIGNAFMELSGGLRVSAGVRAEVFGFPFLDHQETVVDVSKLLGQWSISRPTSPPTTSTKTDTLYPTKDVHTRWSSITTAIANTNYNLDTLRLKRDEGRSYEETLIQFPISSLPSTAKINSAILSLYGYCGRNYAGGVNSSAVKVEKDWSESGVTWNSKPSYTPSSYGNLSSPNGGYKIRQNMNITSLAKEWSANRNQNYGLALIINDNEASCTFHSRENSDATTRPRLIISYD